MREVSSFPFFAFQRHVSTASQNFNSSSDFFYAKENFGKNSTGMKDSNY